MDEATTLRIVLSNLGWIMSRRSFADLAPLLTRMKNPVKELSEALPVFMKLREIAPRYGWTLVDVCSGKYALLSVLTVLNIKSSYAVPVDIEAPSPILKNYRRIVYVRGDIFSEETFRKIRQNIFGEPIVAGIHCCKSLALKTIDIAHRLGARTILLIPCCSSFRTAKALGMWRDGMPKTYEKWAEIVAKYGELKRYKARLEKVAMLSPKNILITLTRRS